jgi:hypothetical protein
MSKVKQIEPLKLISHLRGEVGEIIQSWVILQIYNYKSTELQTEDLLKDMKNENLTLLNIVRSKFRDDIISRLSELSSTTHGRVNFNFASDKFKIQKQEIRDFREFLNKNNLIFRRNKNISHKQISPKWNQRDPSPHIPNKVITRAVAWAMVIMKKFDKEYYGNDYRRFWLIEREKRYKIELAGRAKYMLLPHIRKNNKNYSKQRL